MRNESCYRHTRDTNGLAIRKAVDWRSVDSAARTPQRSLVMRLARCIVISELCHVL